jgi:hypothetical protein
MGKCLVSSFAPLPPAIRSSRFRTVLVLEIFDSDRKYPVILKADRVVFATDWVLRITESVARSDSEFVGSGCYYGGRFLENVFSLRDKPA